MNLKYLTDCKLSVNARGIADNIETDFALSRNQSNRSVFRISSACALRKNYTEFVRLNSLDTT